MFDSTTVALTGKLWVGAGGSRAIGRVLDEMLMESRQNIYIVAYRLTVSLSSLIEKIEQALARGCNVGIVLDGIESNHPAERGRFEKLLKDYPNLSIWDFNGNSEDASRAMLHAKVIVCDRKKAIVGSANFSKNGLDMNHEMAVVLRGRTAATISKAIDQLISEGIRMGILTKR